MSAHFFTDFPAMILAAGRGERMRPLTDRLPKPMLEVHGKNLLQYHIEGLKKNHFKKVVINHAWLGDRIEAYFGNGSAFGIDILYSAETEALETAGGIRNALQLLDPSDYFLVLNGDTFMPDFPFERISQLVEKLRRENHLHQPQTLAHLFLVPNPPHHPEGDFCLLDNQILPEGLVQPELVTTPQFTFSGAGIYHRDLFNHIGYGQKAPLAPLLREAINQRRVRGEVLECAWHDVGTPDRLYSLNESI